MLFVYQLATIYKFLKGWFILMTSQVLCLTLRNKFKLMYNLSMATNINQHLSQDKQKILFFLSTFSNC